MPRSTAASCPHFYCHCLFPHHTGDRNLILGGNGKCVSNELDLMDPVGDAASRLAGFWAGLRHVETAHQLCGIWRKRTLGDGPYYTSRVPAVQLPAWIAGSSQRACANGLAQPQPAQGRR